MKRIVLLAVAVLSLASAAVAHAEPSQWGISHVAIPPGETVLVAPEGPANLNVLIKPAHGKGIKLKCAVETKVGLSNDGTHGLAEWQQFAPTCKGKKEAMCPAATMRVTLGQGVLEASATYQTSFQLETPVQIEVSCSGIPMQPFTGTMVMYPGDYDCVGIPAEGIDEVDRDLKWKREAPSLTNLEGAVLSFSTGGFGYDKLVAAYFNGEPNDCASHGEEEVEGNARLLHHGKHVHDGPRDGDDG